MVQHLQIPLQLLFPDQETDKIPYNGLKVQEYAKTGRFEKRQNFHISTFFQQTEKRLRLLDLIKYI